VKTRTRVILSLVAIAVIGLVALMGTGAVIVLRNLRITRPAASTLDAQFDEVRRRFPARPPLIQIDDPLRGRAHVNHPPDAAPLQHLDRFEILAWQAEEEKLVQTRAPIWMMRFSMLNLLSEFGLAPGSLRLTVDDVQRYGPGIMIDFTSPKGDRVLVITQ
jgi:hypothetical protein